MNLQEVVTAFSVKVNPVERHDIGPGATALNFLYYVGKQNTGDATFVHSKHGLVCEQFYPHGMHHGERISEVRKEHPYLGSLAQFASINALLHAKWINVSTPVAYLRPTCDEKVFLQRVGLQSIAQGGTLTAKEYRNAIHSYLMNRGVELPPNWNPPSERSVLKP